MSQELVSILIPAYNKERWISETIESALMQTWSNKELIIVDDGSRDRTLEVIKGFESNNVKVIAQENQGACNARNRAYSVAQGSYIQWLDADDLLHPQKIEAQMRRAVTGAGPLSLKTAGFGFFYFRRQRAKFRPTGLWQDLSPADWIITSFMERAWMNPTAWLVSRELTDAAGEWDSRLAPSGADDGEYIYRVVSNSQGVEFCEGAKCYYRVGNLSSLNHNSERALDSLSLALIMSVRHLLNIENSERSKRASLRYLQDWFYFFYGRSDRLVQELQAVASNLGGSLIEPVFGWKYVPIRLVLGWNAANVVRKYVRLRRMLVEKTFDYFLHRAASRLDVPKRVSEVHSKL